MTEAVVQGSYAAFCSAVFEKQGAFPDPVWPPTFRYVSSERENVTETEVVEVVPQLLFPKLLEKCRAFFPRNVDDSWRWHVARTVVRSATWHARASRQIGEIDLLFCLILCYEGGVRYGLEGLLDPPELFYYQCLSSGKKALVRAVLSPAAEEELATERKKLLWDERGALRELFKEGQENREFSLRHQGRAVADLTQKYRGRIPFGIVAVAFACGLQELPADNLISFLEGVVLPKTKEECARAGEALRGLLTDSDRQDEFIGFLSEALPRLSGTDIVRLAERASESKYDACAAEFLLPLLLVIAELDSGGGNSVDLAAQLEADMAHARARLPHWIARSVVLLGEPQRDRCFWVRSRALYELLGRRPEYIDALSWAESTTGAASGGGSRSAQVRYIFPAVEEYDRYAAALNRQPPNLQRAKEAYFKLVESHEALGSQLWAQEGRED